MSTGLATLQADVQAAILGQGGTALPGLDIYRSAYRLRLTEALAADYPVLRRWLGGARFDELARDYLEAHPSRHFSIRWFGRALPEYLERQGPLEWAEMARFEWALSLAFDCADSKPLAPETLAGIPPQDWPRLRFTVCPGFSLLRLRTSVPHVWKALQAGEDPPRCRVLSTPTAWMVWRQGLRQFFRSLSEAEAECLVRLESGAAFGEVCAGLSGCDLPTDAARQIALWLRCWLKDGVVTGLRG